MTPAGLEPAIPGSVGRCLIHWATGPIDAAQNRNNIENTIAQKISYDVVKNYYRERVPMWHQNAMFNICCCNSLHFVWSAWSLAHRKSFLQAFVTIRGNHDYLQMRRTNSNSHACSIKFTMFPFSSNLIFAMFWFLSLVWWDSTYIYKCLSEVSTKTRKSFAFVMHSMCA